MLKNENVRVFKDTLKQTRDEYPYDMDEVRYYNGDTKTVDITEDCPPIIMIKGGTVSTGYSYADKRRVAILNFADGLVPGGLVDVGANTQEENICRCSNLYASLSTNMSAEKYYIPNACTEDVYTDRIIYSRDVTVFKDDITYENIKPRKLDVITSPAPSTYLMDSDAQKVYFSRITQIVLSAIENGVQCIVLGAWGCGAFGQSPELVAREFARVLNNYGGYFDNIVFAIRPTYGESTSDTYKVFDRVLTKNYKGGVMYEE